MVYEASKDYGAALVVDFRRFYNLSFVDAFLELPPGELFALVEGLPPESLYSGRHVGEDVAGWGTEQFLALNIRDTLEEIRATIVSIGNSKPEKVRLWNEWPGYSAQQKKQKRAKIDRKLGTLKELATKIVN